MVVKIYDFIKEKHILICAALCFLSVLLLDIFWVDMLMPAILAFCTLGIFIYKLYDCFLWIIFRFLKKHRKFGFSNIDSLVIFTLPLILFLNEHMAAQDVNNYRSAIAENIYHGNFYNSSIKTERGWPISIKLYDSAFQQLEITSRMTTGIISYTIDGHDCVILDNPINLPRSIQNRYCF